MVRQIVVTATAEKQIDAYLTFIAKQWPNKVVKQAASGLKEKLLRIATDPELYIGISERKGVRRCFHPPHLHIYFSVDESKVTVLSVFDARQDPDKLKI